MPTHSHRLQLANPYRLVAAEPASDASRVAGRALAVGAIGLGAVAVFTGTGFAAEDDPVDGSGSVVTVEGDAGSGGVADGATGGGGTGDAGTGDGGAGGAGPGTPEAGRPDPGQAEGGNPETGVDVPPPAPAPAPAEEVGTGDRGPDTPDRPAVTVDAPPGGEQPQAPRSAETVVAAAPDGQDGSRSVAASDAPPATAFPAAADFEGRIDEAVRLPVLDAPARDAAVTPSPVFPRTAEDDPFTGNRPSVLQPSPGVQITGPDAGAKGASVGVDDGGIAVRNVPVDLGTLQLKDRGTVPILGEDGGRVGSFDTSTATRVTIDPQRVSTDVPRRAGATTPERPTAPGNLNVATANSAGFTIGTRPPADGPKGTASTRWNGLAVDVGANGNFSVRNDEAGNGVRVNGAASFPLSARYSVGRDTPEGAFTVTAGGFVAPGFTVNADGTASRTTSGADVGATFRLGDRFNKDNLLADPGVAADGRVFGRFNRVSTDGLEQTTTGAGGNLRLQAYENQGNGTFTARGVVSANALWDGATARNRFGSAARGPDFSAGIDAKAGATIWTGPENTTRVGVAANGDLGYRVTPNGSTVTGRADLGPQVGIQLSPTTSLNLGGGYQLSTEDGRTGFFGDASVRANSGNDGITAGVRYEPQPGDNRLTFRVGLQPGGARRPAPEPAQTSILPGPIDGGAAPVADNSAFTDPGSGRFSLGAAPTTAGPAGVEVVSTPAPATPAGTTGAGALAGTSSVGYATTDTPLVDIATPLTPPPPADQPLAVSLTQPLVTLPAPAAEVAAPPAPVVPVVVAPSPAFTGDSVAPLVDISTPLAPPPPVEEALNVSLTQPLVTLPTPAAEVAVPAAPVAPPIAPPVAPPVAPPLAPPVSPPVAPPVAPPVLPSVALPSPAFTVDSIMAPAPQVSLPAFTPPPSLPNLSSGSFGFAGGGFMI